MEEPKVPENEEQPKAPKAPKAPKKKAAPDVEVQVIAKITGLLKSLSADQQARAVKYLETRYPQHAAAIEKACSKL